MNKVYFFIPFILIIGIGIGFSLNVSAEEALIPSWIKDTAKFWVDGNIGDKEFLSALQFLVKEEILIIPTIDEPKTSTNEPTKSQETLPFEIKVLKCAADEYGFIDIDFSVKNNLDKNYTLDLSLLLVDSLGNVLDVVEHYTDTTSGRTAYDERSFKSHPNAAGCEISIEEVLER